MKEIVHLEMKLISVKIISCTEIEMDMQIFLHGHLDVFAH